MGNIKVRQLQTDSDFWRARAFLREVMHLNGLRELSWHVARWDYWRWHGIANCGMDPFEGNALLWETSLGEIAAILNPENRNSFYLQVHPRHRTAELEKEMIRVAEETLAKPEPGSRWGARIHAHEGDELREGILRKRGYILSGDRETQNRRLLFRPVPGSSIPPGFTIRSLGGAEELPARSWASWRGFHPGEPDEKYEGWEWYRNIQRCPLYRRDLDIVATAPDGAIASFCTIWYDDATRTAYYEPVATVPEYQRLGLGRACLLEGLRRLQQLGCQLAFVNSEEEGPQRFYHAIGYEAHETLRAWDQPLGN
jgi:GNAT superfamily N-acetyltransferase